MALYQIQNEHVLLELDLSNGITITRICDKATNHDYMRFPHSLFEFAVNNSPSYQSNTAVVVTSVLPSADGTGAVMAPRSPTCLRACVWAADDAAGRNGGAADNDRY